MDDSKTDICRIKASFATRARSDMVDPETCHRWRQSRFMQIFKARQDLAMARHAEPLPGLARWEGRHALALPPPLSLRWESRRLQTMERKGDCVDMELSFVLLQMQKAVFFWPSGLHFLLGALSWPP